MLGTRQQVTSKLDSDRASALIGAIYDCVIDPDGWPAVLGEICTEIACAQGALLLLDPRQNQHVFVRTWNTPPDWLERHKEYDSDLSMIYQASYSGGGWSEDEPLVISQHVPKEVSESSRYFREWCRPQGICDGIHSLVIRQADRVGFFSAVRHESVGYVTDQETAIVRLLAPHLRRAATISDVMDMRQLEIESLRAVLDDCSAGIIIADEDARVLHANAAGKEMLSNNRPVRERQGRVTAEHPAANEALRKAMAIARSGESELGSAGLGVSLTASDGEPAVAHVLPLTGGTLRPRLVSHATVAIFVTTAARRPAMDLAAVARSFGLTRAETQLVESVLAGRSLGEAAVVLRIAESTAKTHLAHIYAKTGVARQADLVALLHRLAPRVVPRKSKEPS